MDIQAAAFTIHRPTQPKLEDRSKVEARTSDQPPTIIPHPTWLTRIHQHPTDLLVFPSSSQHCLQIHTQFTFGINRPQLHQRATSGSASTIHIRVASHRAQRLPPTTTAHYWARISIHRIGETSSNIRPPKCSIQSLFWPTLDLWRVFGWLPTWSANSQSKMSCSRTLRTM